MRKLIYVLIFTTLGGQTLADDNNASLCDGMTGTDRVSCEAALALLVSGGSQEPGSSVFAAASSGNWVFRHQTADAKHCAVLVNHLVLPQDRQTRLMYTSQDRLVDLEIAELGIRKTAIPGRMSDTIIEGARLADRAKAELPTAGGPQGASIHVDVLQPAAYGEWERTVVTQSCGSPK
ncbi:Cytochrome C oxidase subunit II, substrate-binding [Rhizobium sp. NFR07]|uniref:hypothetical protein n=1 Tax=Rhizobium sp. NFR07 TaxID=1566262 RepID=UPI0008E1356C|nr:hypothetical protein [Rhizobium sp. NFR07]SFA76063.1 Cytochrome C oxidase subunit II, substrate-binding [Rhizobium sp. NFR07]